MKHALSRLTGELAQFFDDLAVIFQRWSDRLSGLYPVTREYTDTSYRPFGLPDDPGVS